MNTQPLFASAPAEVLLALGIFFTIAAVILLALSTEAGNYREFSHWLHGARQLRPRRRIRRRWYFNTGLTRRDNTGLTS